MSRGAQTSAYTTDPETGEQRVTSGTSEEIAIQVQKDQIQLQRNEIAERRKNEQRERDERRALGLAERVKRNVSGTVAARKSTIISSSGGQNAASLPQPTIVSGAFAAPPNSGQASILGG